MVNKYNQDLVKNLRKNNKKNQQIGLEINIFQYTIHIATN